MVRNVLSSVDYLVWRQIRNHTDVDMTTALGIEARLDVHEFVLTTVILAAGGIGEDLRETAIESLEGM